MPNGTERPGGGSQAGEGRRLDRRRLLELLGATGVAGLAGCSGNQDGEEGEGTPGDGARSVEGTYRSASSVDAQSLNWLTVADSTSGSFISATLDGAWAITPDQEVFPLWADYSTDDGRVYEIELRDNLQWGAGYGQMTAEDWVYMIKNVFQAEDNWSGAPGASDWLRVNPETDRPGPEPFPVEKTGKYTFEIRLFEVDPSFPFKPVMWRQQCAPRALLEQYVPDKDAEGLRQDEELNTLAYTGNLGPYQYVEWERTSQYVVERNDEYYLGEVDDVPERFTNAPYFERELVKVIKEEASRLGALESGDVDSAGVPPDKANRFQNLSGVDLNVVPQPFVEVLVYNMRANGWEPFRDKAVRQALAHAVNKQAVAETIFRGFARVAQTMQPEFSQWYSDEKVTEFGVGDAYGAEVTQSKLESALSGTEYGYDGETLVDGDGEQVELTLTYGSGQPTEQTIAEFVAQEFEKNAGIAVAPQSVNSSTFQDRYAKPQIPEGEEPPDDWPQSTFNPGPRDLAVSQEPWDMSVNLSFNTYPFTPSSSKAFFEKKGSINYYGYYPEANIATHYERAAATTDEQKRREEFGTAFGLISEEQPFGFLSMPSSISGYRSRVAGYTDEFNNGWDSQTWYFE